MYLYRDHLASGSLGKEEEVDEGSSKSDIERRTSSQKSDVP